MRASLAAILSATLALFAGAPAQAALTSDFDAGFGVTNIRLKVDTNIVNFESPLTMNFAYNINYLPLNTSLNLVAMESLQSNQGALNFTRVGAGFRTYPMGMNGQRVIIDSRTEARKFRPSPYVGANVGISNFSITEVSSSIGFFNAVALDAHLVGGNDLTIAPNLFLTAQVVLTMSLSAPQRGSFAAMTYDGIGLFVGLKLASF